MALRQYYTQNLILYLLDFFKGKLTETQVSGEYDLYKDLKHISNF